MIRLNYYVRRKPGMSVEEFQQTLEGISRAALDEDSLTTRGSSLCTGAGSTRSSYRHGHTRKDTRLPASIRRRVGGVLGRDCVLEQALATAEGRDAWQAILEDERKFIDHERSMLSFGTDHPVINPRGKLSPPKDSDLMRASTFHKACRESRCRSCTTLDRDSRRADHDFSEHSPNMRYFQVHASIMRLPMRCGRPRYGKGTRYFGHAEIWTCPAEVEKAAKARVARSCFHTT